MCKNKIHHILRYSLIVFAFVTVYLVSCSSQLTIKENVLSNDKMSMAQHLSTDADMVPEYILGFGDELEIKFFNNERFNETVLVRPDGRISLEKVGDIFVVGMTPSQLDSHITSIYAHIITQPDITVFVRNFGGYQVYVLGHVEKPGGYPIERGMTMLQALALAGGPKNTAQLKSTIVLRRDEEGVLNAIKVDLSRPVKLEDNKLVENDLYVQPTDIIYIPQTKISNANRFLEQVYASVFPPVDVYLRALWYTVWMDK